MIRINHHPKARLKPYVVLLGMICLVLIFVSGCGRAPSLAVRAASGGIYKIGTPYQIGGIWFRPQEDPTYRVIGTASWYGKKFDGKRTANGETFDMNLMTAAHPTLPMPVLVQVTSLVNLRKIVVRVNDRGPFKRGRTIDLSRAAAKKLGFLEEGTARVRVEYIGRAPLYNYRGKLVVGEIEKFISPKPTTPLDEQKAWNVAPIVPVAVSKVTGIKRVQKQKKARSANNYVVQVGAFVGRSNADQLQRELATRTGYKTHVIASTHDGNPIYHVRVGARTSRKQATAMITKLTQSGFDATLIATNE